MSERTIKRDITALQQAGLPIFGEPGHSGGYRHLVTPTPLPPVTFTPAEAAAIAIALGTQDHLPFAPDGASALGKILHSLAPGDRHKVGDLLSRVGSTNDGGRSRAARVLDEAIRQRLVVKIIYADGRGKRTVWSSRCNTSSRAGRGTYTRIASSDGMNDGFASIASCPRASHEHPPTTTGVRPSAQARPKQPHLQQDGRRHDADGATPDAGGCFDGVRTPPTCASPAHLS